MDVVELHSKGRTPGPSFRIGSGPAVLQSIHRPDTNVVVWRRSLPSWVTAALERWLVHAPAERLNVPVDFGAAVPDCAPLLASFADAKLRAWLAKDLTLLGGTLAALADQAMLHVQLGAAHTDRCKKLHVDYVSLRLITTYYGPGTEWLPNDAARRSVLAEPPECHREANAQIVRDGRRLRRARAGDVLVLKGERSAPGAGAIHRSPAIEATGESRVVVSLTAR